MERIKQHSFTVCEEMTKELGFEVCKDSTFCFFECPHQKGSKKMKNGDLMLSCDYQESGEFSDLIFILLSILKGC